MNIAKLAVVLVLFACVAVTQLTAFAAQSVTGSASITITEATPGGGGGGGGGGSGGGGWSSPGGSSVQDTDPDRGTSGGLTTIEDGQTPLSTVEIPDGGVPLGSLPKTGGGLNVPLLLVVLGAAFMAGAFLMCFVTGKTGALALRGERVSI